MRRRRVRSSRGNHAAAITSSCAPTSTESEGRITDSATRSLRPGGGAEASSPRASGLRAAAGPTAALSTMIETGSVATVRAPWRPRPAPITSVPARSVRSRSSRVVVRHCPTAPSSDTSVTSREPTIVKPVSAGSVRLTGSAVRERARTVRVSCSPAGGGCGPPALPAAAPDPAGRRAPRGRSSPVLHSRLRDAALPAAPIAAGLHLLLPDRAEDLLGLGLAQSPGRGRARRATPALPGLSWRCATAAPSPGGRVVARAAAATTPHRQLEVPFGGEVTGGEQQGFAIGALCLGPMRVPAYGGGAGHPQPH